MNDHFDRMSGTLLGCALGDALGLPAEGLSPESISRRFGPVDRFQLLGRTGFVSDDTEQSALVAQSLLREPVDAGRCARAFRRSLLGWFLRLPWGIGLATLRACVRIAARMKRTGVASAGNGAAMRAPIVGAFFREDARNRAAFGRALAESTHVDPRAVDGALFVAEVAALAAASENIPPTALVEQARSVVANLPLRAALDRAIDFVRRQAPVGEAAQALGTSGFVVHSVPFAAFCFGRFGSSPLASIQETIRAGGDTDTNAAMVGAWAGALHGESGLPAGLVGELCGGPFGPDHLRSLARELAELAKGSAARPPRYSAVVALLRNLALYPVILGHGFRRLAPW